MKYMRKIQGQLRIIQCWLHEKVMTNSILRRNCNPINPIHHIQEFLAYGGLGFSAPLPPLELIKNPPAKLQRARKNKFQIHIFSTQSLYHHSMITVSFQSSADRYFSFHHRITYYIQWEVGRKFSNAL